MRLIRMLCLSGICFAEASVPILAFATRADCDKAAAELSRKEREVNEGCNGINQLGIRWDAAFCNTQRQRLANIRAMLDACYRAADSGSPDGMNPGGSASATGGLAVASPYGTSATTSDPRVNAFLGFAKALGGLMDNYAREQERRREAERQRQEAAAAEAEARAQQIAAEMDRVRGQMVASFDEAGDGVARTVDPCSEAARVMRPDRCPAGSGAAMGSDVPQDRSGRASLPAGSIGPTSGVTARTSGRDPRPATERCTELALAMNPSNRSTCQQEARSKQAGANHQVPGEDAANSVGKDRNELERAWLVAQALDGGRERNSAANPRSYSEREALAISATFPDSDAGKTGVRELSLVDSVRDLARQYLDLSAGDQIRKVGEAWEKTLPEHDRPKARFVTKTFAADADCLNDVLADPTGPTDTSRCTQGSPQDLLELAVPHSVGVKIVKNIEGLKSTLETAKDWWSKLKKFEEEQMRPVAAKFGSAVFGRGRGNALDDDFGPDAAQ